MSVGKYSPTVSRAYANDQKWWEKNGGGTVDVIYDKDGYDSYGYNKDDVDRAGYTESEYLLDGRWYTWMEGTDEEYENFEYHLYESISRKWWPKVNPDGTPKESE